MDNGNNSYALDSSKLPRSPSITSLTSLSLRSPVYQSALARNLQVQSVDMEMPNQSTPLIERKPSSTEFDFHCARKSLDSLEMQLSQISNSIRLTKPPIDESLPKSNDMASIKNMMLESEVEKLKWQLELAENSRDMYHGLMKEMIRFLQRCHRDLNTSITSGDTSDSSEKSSSTSSNSTKSSDSSDNTTESSPAYSKYKEYYSSRSVKRQPEPPAAAKVAKEAFRLLRTAQNLVSTCEPDFRPVPSTPTLSAKNRQSIAKSPNFSLQRKTLFQSPMKSPLCQRNSEAFWEKADGKPSRLSLPVSKPQRSKEPMSSSTEDEEIRSDLHPVLSKSPLSAKKHQSIAKSPNFSLQRKTLFQSPMNSPLCQRNSEAFWAKTDGKPSRLSLPVTKLQRRKEPASSSTEDEGIGGSVKSVNQEARKTKSPTETIQNFLFKRTFLRRISSIESRGKK